MSAIAVNTAQQTAAKPVAGAGSASGRPVAVSAWSCLLVSGDDALRGVLRRAVTAAGWAASECSDPGEAIRRAVVHDYPFAVIDIGSGDHRREACADLVRVLRSGAGNLVVVCDRESLPDAELWSRQEGAWMYLPSVDEQSDLARICREAKKVIEKLRGPAAPARQH